jgi:hypothetical protein
MKEGAKSPICVLRRLLYTKRSPKGRGRRPAIRKFGLPTRAGGPSQPVRFFRFRETSIACVAIVFAQMTIDRCCLKVARP